MSALDYQTSSESQRPDRRRRVAALALDIVRRIAAVVCLATAYRFVTTGFEQVWLYATLLSAAVVATGPAAAQAPPPPQPLPWPDSRQLLARLAPGWVLMAAAAGLKALHAAPQIVALTWLCGAVVLLAGAAVTSRRLAVAPAAGPATWIWLAVILAFAAALRLWEIDAIPRQVHCDEGTVTFAAQRFYANPDRDWFAPPERGGSYSIMNLFFALVGLGTLPLGLNLVGARASDVVLGTLSVGLLFDALRRSADLRVAVAGAVLLAANHCHVAYSRIASGYIQTAFVVSLLFCLGGRLWARPTYLNAAALGIAAALGVQTYPASLVSLPLLVATLAVLVAVDGRRRRGVGAAVVLFAISCTCAAAPYGVALWQQGDEMLGRSREINIFAPHMMEKLKKQVYHTDSTPEVVAAQAWNAIRGFQVGRDAQPQYGINQPMADLYTGALIVPGVVFALFGLRRFPNAAGLIFGVGYLLLGLGLQYAPGFNRTTGALPAGTTVAALALVSCCSTFWRGRFALLRIARDLSIGAVLTLAVAANLQIYFVDFVFGHVTGDADSETGWIAREYAGRYRIHLVHVWLPGFEGLRLLTTDVPVIFNESRDPVGYVRSVEPSGDDLFILRSEDPAARDALLERFPNARVEERRRHPVHGPTMVLVFVEDSETSGLRSEVVENVGEQPGLIGDDRGGAEVDHRQHPIGFVDRPDVDLKTAG